MDQDDLIKKEQYYFNGSQNIQENGTILSEIKEEMDPMPVYDGQIKDDKDLLDNCDIVKTQEKSNTAETVNKTHLSKDKESVHEGIKVLNCNICDGLTTCLLFLGVFLLLHIKLLELLVYLLRVQLLNV